MVLVVVYLVDTLRLFEVAANISEEFVAFRHVLGHRRDARLAVIVRADRRPVTTITTLNGVSLRVVWYVVL
jgi:hypothetical protein